MEKMLSDLSLVIINKDELVKYELQKKIYIYLLLSLKKLPKG